MPSLNQTLERATLKYLQRYAATFLGMMETQGLTKTQLLEQIKAALAARDPRIDARHEGAYYG